MRRRDEKRPPPPDELVGALQDRIHPTSGGLVATRRVTVAKQLPGREEQTSYFDPAERAREKNREQADRIAELDAEQARVAAAVAKR